MSDLVLASASPRRRELLALLISDFDTMSVDIDETPIPGEDPEDYVLRLAREKAAACPVGDAVVVAADTTVTVDHEILGKPGDRDQARQMLSHLSGRAHRVLTGVAVRSEQSLNVVVVVTEVEFADLSPALIESYLDTAEPWDKAGAYGIQGFAGSFVRRIDGSYSAVVGLPLLETRVLLAAAGMRPRWPSGENG